MCVQYAIDMIFRIVSWPAARRHPDPLLRFVRHTPAGRQIRNELAARGQAFLGLGLLDQDSTVVIPGVKAEFFR
jgi:hypothetical protein